MMDANEMDADEQTYGVDSALYAATRLPPSDVDAEQALLGALLVDSRPLATVVEDVPDDFFYGPANQYIFEAARHMMRGDTKIDPVALRDKLASLDSLDKVGGSPYLMTLFDAMPTATNWEYYFQLVEAAWVRRKLIAACNQIMGQCHSNERDPDLSPLEAAEEIKADMLHELLGIRVGEGRAKTTDVATVLRTTMRHVDAASKGDLPPSLSTGFDDVDDFLPSGGLMRRWVYVLGGRTSMGKTSFCEAIVRNVLAAKPETKVLMFTLETGSLQFGANIIAESACVSTDALLRGDLTEEGWTGVIEAIEQLRATNLHVNESTKLTPATLLAEARAIKLQADGLDLVVIDYLQRIKCKGRSREEEVAAASDICTVLAKDLDVPVVVAAQLSRGALDRKDHIPTLSDLRYSGAIEQDADVVMLLHRPGYYDDKEDMHKAQLFLAKNRNGMVGVIPLRWDGPTKRFENLHGPAGEYDAYRDGPRDPIPQTPESPPDNRAGRETE